jgi:hypothetical protein
MKSSGDNYPSIGVPVSPAQPGRSTSELEEKDNAPASTSNWANDNPGGNDPWGAPKASSGENDAQDNNSNSDANKDSGWGTVSSADWGTAPTSSAQPPPPTASGQAAPPTLGQALPPTLSQASSPAPVEESKEPKSKSGGTPPPGFEKQSQAAPPTLSPKASDEPDEENDDEQAGSENADEP